MSTTWLFQIQSALILALMALGILWRRNRRLHVRTMLTVIVWDVLLIAQIELTRKAVARASQVITNPMMLNIHVSLAVTCVLLYLVMIFTGRRLLQGRFETRPLHQRLGWATVAMRALVFITSFFAVTA